MPTVRCTEVAWDSATIVSLTGCLPILNHQTYEPLAEFADRGIFWSGDRSVIRRESGQA